MVRFWYCDNRDPDETEGRGRRKILPLPVDEFLSRLLEDVPPPGLQTVRPYGLALWRPLFHRFSPAPWACPVANPPQATENRPCWRLPEARASGTNFLGHLLDRPVQALDQSRDFGSEKWWR